MCKVYWSICSCACKAGTDYSVPVSSWSKLCHIPAFLLVSQCTMMAHQWNGNTSSICLSSQTSAPFLIKESTFSCSLQLVCGTRCHRMLLWAKNSARCKKNLNADFNNIFFETEIQLIFQFWGQYTTFKDLGWGTEMNYCVSGYHIVSCSFLWLLSRKMLNSVHWLQFCIRLSVIPLYNLICGEHEYKNSICAVYRL